MKRNILLFFIITALITQIFTVTPLYAFTSTNIAPSVFSPDGNGLNDTTVFTVVDTAAQTHYVNIFNQSSGEIVAEDRAMTESPSGTYKYTWNGKDDSNAYVDEETYIIRISTNPSENGDTIGTVEVDLTAPSSPSLSIAGGATYTTSRSVTLTIGATDASKMQVSNYNNQFSNVSWENYASSKSWTLASNDGTKTVYINFRDVAGTNVSTSDTITLDTSLDTPSLTINSGASTTSTRSVTLTITAADEATQMKIDNNTGFANMTSWITKSSEYDFTLPSGDGNKVVYLRVRDAAGNFKNASDNITLISAVPTGLTLSINNGATYTNSSNVTLTVSASGGPTTMYFSNDGSTWTAYDYEEIHYWPLISGDGTKTVYYKARNGAGNSSQLTASITLDTSPPTPVTLLLPLNGNTTDTQTPTLTWSNPNVQSATRSFYVELLQSGSVYDASFLNSTTTNYTTDTLEDGGTYSWRVTVYDMANNTATTSQRSFTVDVEGLAAPSVSRPANTAHVKDLSPTFQWSEVTGATSYDLYYGDTEEPLDNTITGIETPTYSDLSFSEGETVYWAVDSFDGTNHSSYSSTRSFTIDTTAPTGCNISIDSNATYTDSSTVTLTLSATGASMMMISNSADFSGASWETYTASKSWPLTADDGEKTVYFKAKDSAVNSEGTSDPNIATATNDTIILDTTAPSISDPDPADPEPTTTTTNLAIQATLNDTGSGVNTNAVTLTLDDVSIDPDDLTITDELVLYIVPTIEIGTHTVNVTATDYAGYTGYLNWSFTVEEEEAPPPGAPPGADTTPVISGVSHSPTTITSSVTVTVSATVTAVNNVKTVTLFWNDGTLHSKLMTLPSGHLYKATIGPFAEGKTITYYIIAIDNSSQSKRSSTYTFTVKDTTAPTITVVSPTDGATITERTPTIEATYTDTGGINTTKVKFTFDGTDVTALSTVTALKITYTPTTQLSYKEYTVALEVSDRAGNKATKTWTFTVVAEEKEMTETITEITSGETKTVDFATYDTALQEITITAATNLEDVTVHCTVLGEKPEGVTLPSNAVYLYLVIETNVEASSISSAVISFKVEQAWLKDNSIEKTSVKLLRYTATGWQELVPTIASEDATYVYYHATTSGFSTFAVTGVVQQVGGGEFPLLFIAIIVIVLAIIALIVMLYYRGII